MDAGSCCDTIILNKPVTIQPKLKRYTAKNSKNEIKMRTLRLPIQLNHCPLHCSSRALIQQLSRGTLHTSWTVFFFFFFSTTVWLCLDCFHNSDGDHLSIADYSSNNNMIPTYCKSRNTRSYLFSAVAVCLVHWLFKVTCFSGLIVLG